MTKRAVFDRKVETEQREQCLGYFGLLEFGGVVTHAPERGRVRKYTKQLLLQIRPSGEEPSQYLAKKIKRKDDSGNVKVIRGWREYVN